jgi:apolipoprotein N-acyltransferase
MFLSDVAICDAASVVKYSVLAVVTYAFPCSAASQIQWLHCSNAAPPWSLCWTEMRWKRAIAFGRSWNPLRSTAYSLLHAIVLAPLFGERKKKKKVL